MFTAWRWRQLSLAGQLRSAARTEKKLFSVLHSSVRVAGRAERGLQWHGSGRFDVCAQLSAWH